MSKNLKVKLTINADGNVRGVVHGINNDLTKTESQTKKLNTATDSLGASLQRIGHYGAVALAGFQLSNVVADTVRTADAYASLQGQLKLVTDSHEELAYVQKELKAISNETRADISSAVSLYSALSPTMEQLGKDTSESTNLVELYNKSLALTSPNAVQASSATLQFAQAMGSGVLRGDEFNSIMENGRGVALMLADGLDVPIGALRSMAEQGELTAEKVISALERQADVIEEKFTQIPLTVSGAWQNVRTNTMLYIGDVDQSIAASLTLAESIDAIAQNVDVVATVIGGTLVVATASAIGKMTQYTAARVVDTRATIRSSKEELARLHGLKLVAEAEHRASIAILQKAAAQKSSTAYTVLAGEAERAYAVSAKNASASSTHLKTATLAYSEAAKSASIRTRALSGFMGLLGGPVGLAVTAAAGIYAFREELGLVRAPAINVSDEIDKLTRNIDRLTVAQARQRILNSRDAYEQAKADVDKYSARIEYLEVQLKRFPRKTALQESLINARADYDTATQALQKYDDTLKILNDITLKEQAEMLAEQEKGFEKVGDAAKIAGAKAKEYDFVKQISDLNFGYAKLNKSVIDVAESEAYLDALRKGASEDQAFEIAARTRFYLEEKQAIQDRANAQVARANAQNVADKKWIKAVKAFHEEYRNELEEDKKAEQDWFDAMFEDAAHGEELAESGYQANKALQEDIESEFNAMSERVGTSLTDAIVSGNWQGVGQTIGGVLAGELSSQVSASISTSIAGSAGMVAGATGGALAGAAVQTIAGSLFGGGNSISTQERANKQFEEFIENLEEASERLTSFGNTGSAASNEIDTILRSLAAYQSGENVILERKARRGISATYNIDGEIVTESRVEDYVNAQIDNLNSQAEALLESTLPQYLDYSEMLESQLTTVINNSGIDLNQLENATELYGESVSQLTDMAVYFKSIGGTANASAQELDEYSTLLADVQAYEDAKGAIDEYYSRLDDVSNDVSNAWDTFYSQSLSIEEQLMALVGAEELLAYQRAKEVEQIDPLLQPMQERLWALQDEQTEIDRLNESHESYIDSLSSAQDFLTGTFKTIREFALGLTLGAASTGVAYASTLELAQSGDRDALSGITSSAQSYLDYEMSQASTLADYNRIQAQVAADLYALPEQVTAEELLAQEITQALESQTGFLSDVLDDLPSGLQAVVNSTEYDISALIDFAVNDAALTTDLRSLLFESANAFDRTIDLTLNADELSDANEALILNDAFNSTATLTTLIEQNADKDLISAVVEGEINASAIISAVLADGTVSEVEQMVLEGTVRSSAVIDAALNSGVDDDIKRLILNDSKTYIANLDAVLTGSLSDDENLLLSSYSDEIVKTLTTNGGSLTYDENLLLSSYSDEIIKTLTTNGGSLTYDENLLLSSYSDEIIKTLTANGGNLTDDQRSILDALTGDLSTTLDANVITSGTVSIGDAAESALEDLGSTVEQQKLKVEGIVELTDGIDDLTTVLGRQVLLDSQAGYEGIFEAESVTDQADMYLDRTSRHDELADIYERRASETSGFTRVLALSREADQRALAQEDYDAYLDLVSQSNDIIAANLSEYEAYIDAATILGIDFSTPDLDGFSQGGFTPNIGVNSIAGVVHGGEYVAPNSQISQYPELFAALEADRQGQTLGFMQGGFVDFSMAPNAGDSVKHNARIEQLLERLVQRVEQLDKLGQRQFSQLSTLVRNSRESNDYQQVSLTYQQDIASNTGGSA